MSTITLSNTDQVCVVVRKIGILHNPANRIQIIVNGMGCDETTARRFDWFAQTLSETGILCSEAIAAAWVANEEYGYDGTNNPEDTWSILTS